MAKDYFQDIVPPSEGRGRSREIENNDEVEVTGDRSIRNVQINPRGRRPEPAPAPARPRARRRPRRMLWIIAGVCVLLLAGLALLAFRPTTITVTPRTHTVVFDDTNQYTAYATNTAPTGALTYSVKTFDLDDSDVVASAGVVHANDKASGQITVYNNYATTPVKLVQNTRFATPDGLIFRAPADIVVPGKTASGPGKVTITVVADQPGQQYNVGPFAKLTLPGLQGSAEFTGVYAASSAAFTGGFVGDKPGVSEADTDKAVAAIRTRLADKARSSAEALATDALVVFPDLMQISYEDAPATTETGGQVRIHETAHVNVPLFPADDFAHAVAQSVSSDADGADITIVPGTGYGASMLDASSSVGTDPLQFKLTGNATILWRLDSLALATALAGRDQGAFQTVVNTFPAIQEAHARIEPFWSSTFPKDPKAIKVTVNNPTT